MWKGWNTAVSEPDYNGSWVILSFLSSHSLTPNHVRNIILLNRSRLLECFNITKCQFPPIKNLRVLLDGVQGLWQSSLHPACLMSPSMYLKTVLMCGSLFCHYKKFSATSPEHVIWGDHGHSDLAPNKPCLLFL